MLSIARKSKWLCSSSASCGQVDPPYYPNTYKIHFHSFHHFTVRHDEVQRSISSAPLQVGLSVYFIWDLLGPSVLVGKTTSVNCKRTVLNIVVFTIVLFCDLDNVLFTTGMTSLRTGSSCDLSTTECFGTYYIILTKLGLLD